MLIKNNVARLITINCGQEIKTAIDPVTERETIIAATPRKGYDLMPAGPAVSVPAPYCDTDYVKALEEAGDITCTPEESDEAEAEAEGEGEGDVDISKLKKADLTAYVTAMGVTVDPEWTKAEIIKAFEEHTQD